MTVFYLETSIALQVLLREPEYEAHLDLLEQAERVVTSALTLAEVKRVIRRFVSQKILTEGKAQELIGILETQSRGWDVLEISSSILNRAGEHFPIEPIRTLDAIHLASALELKRIFSDLNVLSSDSRIVENVIPLGMSGN